MSRLPTGTVTFLFTDIEASTRLLERLGPRYSNVLADYRGLLRGAFQERGGREVDTQGDGLFYAFGSAKDAVAGAIAAQRAAAAHPWPDGLPARIRMGIHTGEPLLTEAGYIGMWAEGRVMALDRVVQYAMSEDLAASVPALTWEGRVDAEEA